MLGCKGIDFPRIRLFVYYSLKSPKAFTGIPPLDAKVGVRIGGPPRESYGG